MSCLENDIAQESAWDRFCDLYDNNESFRDGVRDRFSQHEIFFIAKMGADESDAMLRVFQVMWEKDCELLCDSPEQALVAL